MWKKVKNMLSINLNANKWWIFVLKMKNKRKWRFLVTWRIFQRLFASGEHEEVAWWSHKNSTLHAVFLLRRLSSNWVPHGRNAKFEIKSWYYLRSGRHASFFLFARSPTFALHTAREKRIARTPDRLSQISLRSPGSMLPTWWSKTD